MSIIISNVGKAENGEHRYELCINKEVLTTFTHKRTDGLAVCLKKAATAAKKYEAVEKDSMVENIMDLLSAFDFTD